MFFGGDLFSRKKIHISSLKPSNSTRTPHGYASNFPSIAKHIIFFRTINSIKFHGILVSIPPTVICGSLGIPPNCTKEVSRSSVGGVASFICNDGYTLQGKSELMCEENGTWSGEVPTCVLVTCDSVTEPANGRMVVSGNNVGGVASFTCEKGYDLEGERELQCLENGTWSAEIPLCVPVTCDSIMEPTNGKKNVSHSHVGGVASFTCNEGYTLHGQDKLVCHENGTWTGEVPNCLADHDISNEPTTPANTSVTCDSVTEPTNGKKNVSHNHVGGVASFTCNEGYTLHGQGKLVCRENGTWTGKVPNCLADHEPTTPADTSGLSGWQLILVICLCCVVSIVLIVAIAKVVLTKRASRTYSLKSDADLIITSVREQPHGVDQTTSM
ncbi:E-selectin-like isoform X1 [Acanthaster planci]|uniref:E-selectin-like isoform X1 n=1 Tax=Acanthaster planci TaxID=133434 RepID=A0A8B7Y7A4_ACAPL|nr:E-selectin-like isoform X1 [Acanthaster planci]